MKVLSRYLLLLGVIWLTAFESSAQQLTTFILVRHAEKADGSDDPELSEAGKARAQRLAEVLSKTSIQAIYSTSYKRTRDTVSPLAKAKGLEVIAYEAKKADPIEKILKDHVGGTVVISGHSNTTPWTATSSWAKNNSKTLQTTTTKILSL
jgi:phosphohistidine phosphatase SixA